MKVCIIGAGASGISTAKVLQEQGIDFDCYEKGSKIGGNWRYNNDNGMSSSYKSLHINTSKAKMAYSDFPMPDDYPEYPNHQQIIDYFEAYMAHFGFEKNIIFNTGVTKVDANKDGSYTVKTDTGLSQNYDAVIVANGHHWNPNYPNFKGDFNGEIMHSHDYKTPDKFIGKKVLIVGIGNSAVDIACELCRLSEKVVVSTRSGAHVIPKYVLGKPIDSYVMPSLSVLPLAIQRTIFKGMLWLGRGKQEDYGMPVPNRPFLSEHPTISQDFLGLVGHGKINVYDNIKELQGKEVLFESGKKEEFDIIIYATGYNVSFPFFNDDFLKSDNNKVELYRHVISPKRPNLFFVGLLQPLGAVMPLSELQSKWIANLVQKKSVLPSTETMYKEIEKEDKQRNSRYFESKRHTMQVDYHPYFWSVEKEMKRVS